MHEVADISSVSEYFISETTELISTGFNIVWSERNFELSCSYVTRN